MYSLFINNMEILVDIPIVMIYLEKLRYTPLEAPLVGHRIEFVSD